ncbi:triosephosphate isomerase, partial [Candidatus Endoriftia persephone str. Guaymas]|nr:triosephosphate isomerase [Candidatus Endoriftia persephone str. Guaymas]
MRKPLVAGNWKMNGSLESVRELLEGLKLGIDAVINAEVAVCPPCVFIPEVQKLLDGSAISWGGQDLSVEVSGAYTGEIAASMLNDFGCKYAIV